jgi:hypothetical protein
LKYIAIKDIIVKEQKGVIAMSEFMTHLFSGRAYTSEEIISFSQCPMTHYPDIAKEMQFHKNVKHIQASSLTQDEFDIFVKEYADNYESIYFFQNPKVKDLSALSCLKNVKFLLFYNFRAAKQLWDMTNNRALKGLFISNSSKLIYNLSAIANVPALEELLLFSNMDHKYTVQSLNPITKCITLKKVMLDCNTENADFDPRDFSHLEVFKYRVDKHRNYQY